MGWPGDFGRQYDGLIHAARVADLPALHRDSFDRLLVAQALVEGVPFVSADGQLAAYGVECVPA